MINFFLAKRNIALHFLVFLVIQIITILILAARDIVPFSVVQPFTINVLKLYSVPLTVILGSKLFTPQIHKIKISRVKYNLVLILSIAWNLLLTIRLLFFVISTSDKLERVMDFQKSVSEYSSFLIAGFLAYFFSSSE